MTRDPHLRVGEPTARGITATTPSRTALLALVIVVSLIVRVAHLVSVYPTPFFSYHQTWSNSDMYMTNQWAQRIVDGDILGRKTYHPLTDWMLQAAPAAQWAEWFGDRPVYLKAPVYTYLVAVLRWLFGDAMLALALLQVVASTLSAALLFLITEAIFGSVAGFAASILFALYAPAIHYDVIMLRGPWIILAALLITWQLVKFRHAPTAGAAAGLGVTVGVALLINEGFIPLPALVLAVVFSWVRRLRRFAVLTAAFVAGLALAVSPLIVRNWLVGAPALQFAISGGYGYTLWNAADSEPLFFPGPTTSFLPLMATSGGRFSKAVWGCLRSFPSAHEFLRLYLQRATGLVVPLEIPDNVSFYYAALKDPLLQLLPTYAFVFPLIVIGFYVCARRYRDLGALVPASLTFFLSIMLTFPTSRYRLQLVVLLLPFAGVALAQAIGWTRARNFAALALAASTLVLLSFAARFLERSVVLRDREPSSVMYRPVEFNVATAIYERQGQFREASQELLQLAHHCDDPAQRADTWMRAARLQIQAGDTVAARASLQAAVELDTTKPVSLFLLGDTWAMLGDTDNARAAYRRLIVLVPNGPYGDAARTRLRSLPASPNPSVVPK